ncbi:MAG: hypothetical protein H6559_34725 [Lewinellaceae bacterium]|nr:hypothetical protein [Lewinellaceae bacterium]
MSLITDSQPILYVLVGILTLFSIGSVFFNSTGRHRGYLLRVENTDPGAPWVTWYYIYVEVNFTNGGLPWYWAVRFSTG